jgi:hypothetical protein
LPIDGKLSIVSPAFSQNSVSIFLQNLSGCATTASNQKTEIHVTDRQAEEMLPLAEVVEALRSEIIKAADAAGPERIRFGVGPIDLEFQVVAKREGGPSGKIKFGIWGVGVEAGGSAKFGNELLLCSSR